MHSIHLVAFLAASVLAVSNYQPQPQCTLYNDSVRPVVSRTLLISHAYLLFFLQYDDLPSDLLPEADPVGVYHGLQYIDFQVSVSHHLEHCKNCVWAKCS